MKAIRYDAPAVAPRLGPTPDNDLMRRSMDNPEAFADIFDRHAPVIHKFLSRRVGELADDLLNETFLTAFRKRGEYRPERADVLPWLYGIGANLVRRHQREEVARYRVLGSARSSETDATLYSSDDFEGAVSRVDAQSLRPRLAAALADLSTGDREVLLLVAWGDLRYAEVAVALDIPVGTVRSRLNRARRQVRNHLPRDMHNEHENAEKCLTAPHMPSLTAQHNHQESR